MNPSLSATALIADDEDALRERLRNALSRCWPQLRVVAEAPDGIEAWDAWLAHEPQVVFLDLRMPGLPGLDVAQRIGARSHIVFLAGPGDHALEAFAAGGVEHLLKPIDEARLDPVVARLQSQLQDAPCDRQALLAQLLARQRAPAPLDMLQAGVGRDQRAIRVDDVVYFEADGRFTRVVQAGGEALVRVPLKELAARLDPKRFRQIHRSAIVNERCIAGTSRGDDGQLLLMLSERPERLAVSRPFQAQFESA